MKNGWFSINRKIGDWEWYNEPFTTKIFIDCLRQAYFTDGEWRGIKIKRGQFPITVDLLATLNGMTTRQTRTALKNLQTTNEIEIQTTNRYSIITVKNYSLYQDNDKQKRKSNDKQKQGVNDKQKQGVNDKPYINNKSIKEIISLSIEERENLKKYIIAKKKNVHDADAYIRKLIDNGDINIILERARKWKEKQEVKSESNNRLISEDDDPLDTEEKRMEAQRRAHELVKNLGRKKR